MPRSPLPSLAFESVFLSGNATYDADKSRAIVPALLFYEGEHVGSNGKAKIYTSSDIEAIAKATNNRLKKGRRVKLFTDHNYAQKGTLGYLDSEVYAKLIENADLPHPGMDELLGKMGIFGAIAIAGAQNIEAYEDGRIKELSVGIDPTGRFSGTKNAIYEISAVPFPALVGATLYEQGEIEEEEDTHGLTLGETLRDAQQVRLEQSIHEVISAFHDTLESIRDATAEALQGQDPHQLKGQAIEDLASQLRSRLGVPSPTVTSVPLFQQEEIMDEEKTKPSVEQGQSAPTEQFSSTELRVMYEQLTQKLEEANRRAEQEAQARQRASQTTKLMRRAEVLVKAGKMTPALFKAMFGTDEDDSTEIYSAHQAKDPVEFLIDMIDQFGTSGIQHGMPVTESLEAKESDGGLALAELFLNGSKIPN